jgi:hypothetical protein
VLDAARGNLDAARVLADRSADARLALRCFERPTSTAAGAASSAPPPDALLVGPCGQWFRAPHAPRVLPTLVRR